MGTLDLPKASTDRLLRSPLELVVCQVRHERNMGVVDPRRALAVHEPLSDRYPDIEQITEQEVSIAPSPKGIQSVSGISSSGWRFKSKDGTWTVSLVPDYYALETTAYEDWEDFRTRFEELTISVDKHLEPALEQRLGMRFIDRITDPEVNDPREWEGWINASLLGPVLDPKLGGALVSARQLLEMEAGEDLRITLRHGFSRDVAGGIWAYILDHDCFRRHGQPFSVDSVLTGVDKLHTLALQVFQAAITPELYDYLRSGNS